MRTFAVNMETTDKSTCRELAALLAGHGIEDVVISPGSRNTPLIIALHRSGRFRLRVVVDERSAAFIALGIASMTQRPVAIVCTSGSALLNYAPAVAEAFYREVPLIVVSADRPEEWIDQDDSQTIRQPGCLANIVKQSIDIPVENGSATQSWMVNRLVNDILIKSVSGRPGPVHINIQLDTPLSHTAETGGTNPRIINVAAPPAELPPERIDALVASLDENERLLVVAGFMHPDKSVSHALERLAALPNTAVLHEAQANIHGEGIIGNIDRVLSEIRHEMPTYLQPTLVITMGGSLVSRFIKSRLRDQKGLRHWHIGIRDISTDCFKCLDTRIEVPAESFLPHFAEAMTRRYADSDSSFRSGWNSLAKNAGISHKRYLDSAPWSDLTAMRLLISGTPAGWDLQASNGTAIRYVQLFDYSHFRRIDCNRGVSGIDGCTSTAVGAAIATGHPTLLVSGDMSAQYDMGALAASDIPPTFRMAVLNNGGGGIFRFIPSTAALPELERYFVADVRLPLRQLADGFGFDYYEADSPESFSEAVGKFTAPSARPAILNIITPGEKSGAILTDYFTRKQYNYNDETVDHN